MSHPAVLKVNQEVYGELARRGWSVQIVVPEHWQHSYSEQPIVPEALPVLEHALIPTRVALAGRPQRHVYLARCGSILRSSGAEVGFVEAEPYALAAAQWGFAFRRRGVPFGVQSYENIDRALPAPVRALRSRVLGAAAFVAARSDTAAMLAHRWGARGEVGLAPPAVPSWPGDPLEPPERPFTIGFAGRLVESKGLLDLLEAARELTAPIELLLIGEGDMRARLEGQDIPGSRVRVIDNLSHEEMASGYAQLDLLVLPSHTTATWKEQLGRVIVEALWCGVPVLGSDSGEIPWLIELTGGGLVFPEGDVRALAERLAQLRADPELRRSLASAGRATVGRMFSVPAATDALEALLSGALKDGARTH